MHPVDFVTFAVAVVICTAGLAALAGHALRPRPSDRLLLWFGVFSGVYGVRMLSKGTLAAALGIPQHTGRWVETSLNYFILVPALLFVEELYGLGWRRSLRWITAATALAAVAALAADLVVGNPGWVPDFSLFVFAAVLIAELLGASAGYRPPPFKEWRVLLAGVSVFMLLVLNEHAVGAGVVPWGFKAEPLGFLVQLGCFGYIALTRVFAQDRELAAVAQEMRSAREIQSSILPRDLPATRDVRMAARYVPLAAVAGDLYDVVGLGGRSLAVLVADVSGHGVPAALIASMAKVAFTAALRETEDPTGILRRMNATLCGMFDRSYVTAACAVLRPSDGVLDYALAGHPPPLLLPDLDGAVEPLEEGGLVLGLEPSATFPGARRSIGSGARLVLYSDGVTETPSPGGELFGAERLSQFVAAERGRGCDSFADELMGSLQRFSGRPNLLHDDVTLLVVDMVKS
jgi:sigma-B regulation protein RsbU (phosphoserine phosphatase)